MSTLVQVSGDGGNPDTQCGGGGDAVWWLLCGMNKHNIAQAYILVHYFTKSFRPGLTKYQLVL